MSDPSTDPGASLEELPESLRKLQDRFDEIVGPEREALWRFCLRLTGSSWDAEDLVQETMLKAFARVTQLWQPMQPRAWLYRIATNAWIDHARRERRLEIGDLEEADIYPTDDTTDVHLHVSDAMRRLICLLPPRQRVILLLSDTLNFRAGEVAAMLETTVQAVKAALHRARETLSRHLADGDKIGFTPLDRADLAPVVARYVEAFNARDPDAIAALLDDAAVTEIVGVAEEHGRAVTRSASLAEWAVDPARQWVEPGMLDGEAVLHVFYQTREHPKALAWMIRLKTTETRIHRQRQYYFCPELIRHAAAQLGVPAVTHGYRYVVPNA